MRHTVVLSDVHLWESVPGDGLWMRYRQRQFFPDAAIAALLARLTRDVPPGDFELVLNGDTFDFDDPCAAEAPMTEAAAAACVGRILDEHPVLVEALARVVFAGHRVVFVAGNHDVQLAFPKVRACIVERIADAARRATPDHGPAARLREVRPRVLFRAWFHRTRDGLHIEHGHQYDPYCAVRFPQRPFLSGTRTIQPTLSSLTMRHLMGRFGYFNPNVDGSFMLSLRGYLSHWARYYLFTRRSLVVAWLVGTARVVAELALAQPREEPEAALHNLLATMRETGAGMEALSEHASRYARQDMLQMSRVLWVDRIALVAAVACAAALAWAHPVAGIALVAALAAVTAVVRGRLPPSDLGRIYQRLEVTQREISRIHDARAVVFGHTHLPEGRWEAGVFVGNCGTWAPMFRDVACTRPLQRGNPFVWLRVGDHGVIDGGLYRVRDGEVAPEFGCALELEHDTERDDGYEDAVA